MLATFGLDKHIDFEVGAYGSDDPVRANLVGIARRRATGKYHTTFDYRSTILVGDTPRVCFSDRWVGLGGAQGMR
jgi:hypothetical protein